MKKALITLFRPALLSGAVALAGLGLAGCLFSVSAQGLSAFDRDNAKAMLNAAKEDLQKNYYDPELRGLDIELTSRTPKRSSSRRRRVTNWF